MARKKNVFKHPRRAPSRRKYLFLAVVLVLICAIFFVLEMTREKYRNAVQQPAEQPKISRMPENRPTVYSAGIYTSARVFPVPSKQERAAPVSHGSLAVIIDDMGSSMKEAEDLLAIGLPVTFAIIPGLPSSRRVAEFAHARGRVVMIHMPMQPKGYPAQKLENNGLLISQSTEEIAGRVRGYLKDVPHASGANNHMGSEFTEHEDKMLPVLSVLKENRLFFVDSRTSSKSVGYTLAHSLGMMAGTRNVFMDNDQDVEAVKKQLKEAARLAGKRGGVIAICHPHPETIQALREMMPVLKNEGIKFVSAAELVR